MSRASRNEHVSIPVRPRGHDRVGTIGPAQRHVSPPDLASALDAIADRVAERVLEVLAPMLEASAPTARRPSLLSKSELASLLHVSTATVDRLARHGALPFVRVGDVRRFDLEAVRRALEERGANASAAPAPDAALGDVRLLSNERTKP
jgi:excisionase family DNA binding protein